jgi:hypothetical protein
MTWTGRAWTFKSNYTGTYLAIDGAPVDGTRLVASTSPFEWHIWRDQTNPNTFRYVPSFNYYICIVQSNPTPFQNFCSQYL